MNSSNTFQWEINPRTRSDYQLADERTSLKKLRENLWIELDSRFPLELTSEELDEFERWIEESPEEPYVDELAELEQFIEDQWLPAVNRHQPDLIFISAGFDAHKDDPLAQIELEVDDYRWVTQLIKDLAKQHCNGRIISTLEGG